MQDIAQLRLKKEVISMGYRSETAFTISHNVKNKLLVKARTRLSVVDYELLQTMLSGKDADEFFENEHGIYVHYQNIKWYCNYEEIRLLEEFINANPEEASFARIGEDYNDLEQYGSFGKVKQLAFSCHITALDGD
jgi:hypothetical protein